MVIDYRHEWEFFDDFFGGNTYGTATRGDPWVITDTSSAGTPTYAVVDLGESTVAGALGSIKIAMDTQEEEQNVCLSFGDKLAFDINKVRGFETRIKMSQATVDAATSFACGLTGDRNDAIDSIAKAALFRVIGADSTTALVAESDDGTTDVDDTATGATLANAWKRLKILISPALIATFFVDDVQVASGTAFSLAAYDAGLQPFFQIQKTSDTNADAFEIDYVHIWGVR